MFPYIWLNKTQSSVLRVAITDASHKRYWMLVQNYLGFCMDLLMLGVQNHPKYTAFTNTNISYIEWVIWETWVSWTSPHHQHGYQTEVFLANSYCFRIMIMFSSILSKFFATWKWFFSFNYCWHHYSICILHFSYLTHA